MPSAEQLALWSAIRSNPDDDTPRLVYADWLQENGDTSAPRRVGGLAPERPGPNAARAEFIRVQCALARLWADPRARLRDREWAKEHKPLAMRQNALQRDHAREWLTPLWRVLEGTASDTPPNEWRAHGQFERGFLRAMNLGMRHALRLVATGEEAEPIDEIVIRSFLDYYDHANIATVVAWSAGVCVSGLHVGGATDADIVAMVSAGQLTGLRELSLTEGSVTAAGVRELAGSRCFRRLEEVTLAENAIGDDGAIALAASGIVGGFKSLGLSRTEIGDSGAAALADSPNLHQLEHLILYGNPIGPAGRQRLRERFGDRVQLEPV